MTEFDVGAQTFDITTGPDGNVWFVEEYGGSGFPKVGRISPNTLHIDTFVGPSLGPSDGITSGPDGNLWFTETMAGRIARITPTGAVTEISSTVRVEQSRAHHVGSRWQPLVH